MPLSVTVHGIPVKTGLTQAGRLATADITAQDGSDVVLYTVPVASDVEWDYLIFSVSVCNRADESATNISIAVADADTPLDSEWVEWNSTLVPYGVLERTQVVATPGQRIILRWENETAGITLDGTSEEATPGNDISEGETAQFILTLRDVNVPDELAYVAPDIYWEAVGATLGEFTAVSGTVLGSAAVVSHDGNTTATAIYPIDITAATPISTLGTYVINFRKTDASGRLLTNTTLDLVTLP